MREPAPGSSPDGQPPRRGKWPAHPVIYQVYPRSFADSTGSGEGDLAGIAERLEHIAALGADAVWIGPIYPSPFADGGYDVADFTGVDPRFGTLENFDHLVARARALDLRVMVDLVFNHTSDAHPWFRASARREADHEDWYVWADGGPKGGLPNNWQSYFGGPAWTWHPERQQYFLHTFLPQQPKLNLRHVGVRAALARVCAFWRARGVEGFRMDAVTSYLHDPALRDNPPARPAVRARIAGPPTGTYKEQDHIHDFLPGDGVPFMSEVRRWAGDDTYLMGEVNSGNRSVELATELVGSDGLDSAYVVDVAERGLTGTVLADMIDRGACKEGLAWWFSTHDQPRHISRAGTGSMQDARLFARLLAALPGPLIVYQGEEVGQPQADLPKDALTDPFDLKFWPDPPGRDGARVPMAWTDGAPGYGFTTGTPWLPMDTGGAPRSVDAQAGVAGSPLETYRTALAERRRLGLAAARIEVLEAEAAWFLARLHREGGPPLLLAVNLGETARRCPGAEAEAGAPVPPDVPARTTVWFLEQAGAEAVSNAKSG